VYGRFQLIDNPGANEKFSSVCHIQSAVSAAAQLQHGVFCAHSLLLSLANNSVECG
jgi:hypothetical protein